MPRRQFSVTGKERTDSNLTLSCTLREIRSKTVLLGRYIYRVNAVHVGFCCSCHSFMAAFQIWSSQFLLPVYIRNFDLLGSHLYDGQCCLGPLSKMTEKSTVQLKGSQKSFWLWGARWSDGRIPQSFLVTNSMKCEGITSAGRSPRHVYLLFETALKVFSLNYILLSFCLLLKRIMSSTDSVPHTKWGPIRLFDIVLWLMKLWSLLHCWLVQLMPFSCLRMLLSQLYQENLCIPQTRGPIPCFWERMFCFS